MLLILQFLIQEKNSDNIVALPPEVWTIILDNITKYKRGNKYDDNFKYIALSFMAQVSTLFNSIIKAYKFYRKIDCDKLMF